MKGGINRDYYCTRFDIVEGCNKKQPEKTDMCRMTARLNLVGLPHKEAQSIHPFYEYCKFIHRKWPTPEQFKGEYGYEWKGARYFLLTDGIQFVWSEKLTIIDGVLYEPVQDNISVCACTPWGKPPDGWRPE